jgi:heme-degrading monooxygenase HmoA
MIIEIVTFKLTDGVTPTEFEPIDREVQIQHVAKQPGFVARESAHGENGEWLVVVHWETARDADASMATFMNAHAAQPFMAKIQAATMRMARYTQLK